MGLDIAAYSRCRFLEIMSRDQYEKRYDNLSGPESDRHVYVYQNDPEFTSRLAPLVVAEYPDVAVYHVDGAIMSFRAGGYAGYNIWRDNLCQMANDVSTNAVWGTRDDPDTRALPFYELIDFSDCEGTIGSLAAKELLGDFVKYADEAKAHDDARGFLEKYQRWHEACYLAADDGMIRFF